jgi:phospholipase C
MLSSLRAAIIGLLCCSASACTSEQANRLVWPQTLPVYDHIVIVIEENKDFEQILGAGSSADCLRRLAAEGASFTNMFAEEHHSQGNYFWLFSGSNQQVGFDDKVPTRATHPDYPFVASNVAEQLIRKGLSFKGYSEDLPTIGDESETAPPHYARKHVPWVSFKNVPNGTTVETSSNLRFADFPTDYNYLPTVAIVIPNLINDMHDGNSRDSIKIGDAWLCRHLDGYYEWARSHNSLLVVTFDENEDTTSFRGLTNPFATAPSPELEQHFHSLKNRVATIFAGAHIKPGPYSEGKGITHVNILRTIEAMYGLSKSGAQQTNAAAGGIGDGPIIDAFEPTPP